MISLKQLRYALSISKHLHFRKAAEDCAVSQSALSTGIAEMEKALGFSVFERDNKKVLITPVGQQFLTRAESILLGVEDLMGLATSDDQPLSHPMSIGLIPTICPYLLPKVLPELGKQLPEFQLNITEQQSHALVEKVKSGELDAAVLALPYPLDGLLSFEFWQENFYWVCHQDADKPKKKRVTANDIIDRNLMLLSEGHCLTDHALAVCQLEQRAPSEFGATSLATLIQLVVGGVGSTLVPEMALNALVTPHKSLTAMPVNEPGPHRKLAFVIRPTYARLKEIEILMELFRKQLT